jgi:hypothetical protein
MVVQWSGVSGQWSSERAPRSPLPSCGAPRSPTCCHFPPSARAFLAHLCLPSPTLCFSFLPPMPSPDVHMYPLAPAASFPTPAQAFVIPTIAFPAPSTSFPTPAHASPPPCNILSHSCACLLDPCACLLDPCACLLAPCACLLGPCACLPDCFAPLPHRCSWPPLQGGGVLGRTPLVFVGFVINIACSGPRWCLWPL